MMKSLIIMLLMLGGFTITYGQELSESNLLSYINNHRQGIYTNTTTQIGNQNTSAIYGNGVQITQVGNLQDFYYFDQTGNPSNMQIYVEGNANQVEVFGSNQLMHGATITIMGNYRDITITNFR